MKLIIYTDGASRGNPGPASYGFVILNEGGKLLYEKGNYIGITTNNVAEYTAVLEALKFVRENITSTEISGIQLYADSRLVAEQLSGRFKIKSLHLRSIIEQIQVLAVELGGAVFTHIPRSKNNRADKLANFALDYRC